jgi:murein DD-endopeptidase MepM/ murein hydrolase activator NlpD
MTQPTQAPMWIQELMQRYSGANRQLKVRRDPMAFQIDRQPFDPSAYYKDIGTLRDISSAGTNVMQQRVANQVEKNRQAELAKMQAAIKAAAESASRNASPRQAAIQFANTGKLGDYGSPLKNYSISSGFGPRNRPTAGASTFHQGLDMAAPMGSPIYATHDGVVSFSGWGGGYGNNILLSAGGGIQTFYGHNSKNVVKSGQQVRRGQLIGYVGSTGISTGPHLHYGIKVNGQWVNPR